MPIEMQHKPPPAKKAPAAKAPPIPAPNEMMGPRAEAVNGFFQLGQAALLMTGQYADAAAVGIHGPRIAQELVALADINERIAKGIDFFITAGPYAGLVTAVLPLVLQIGTNHGRIPEVGIPGVVSPQALRATMEAEVQMQAAQAMQEAALAQERAKQASAALADAMQDNARAEDANGSPRRTGAQAK